MSQVQATIGATNALAFDLTAACSGFVVGLVTGAQFIRTKAYSTVLVIGADALSRYVDWRDRGRPRMLRYPHTGTCYICRPIGRHAWGTATHVLE